MTTPRHPYSDPTAPRTLNPDADPVAVRVTRAIHINFRGDPITFDVGDVLIVLPDLAQLFVSCQNAEHITEALVLGCVKKSSAPDAEDGLYVMVNQEWAKARFKLDPDAPPKFLTGIPFMLPLPSPDDDDDQVG